MCLIKCPRIWERPNINQEVMCCSEPLRTVVKCLNGTEGGTRTHTVSPPPDFESGASTNSATPARVVIIAKK